MQELDLIWAAARWDVLMKRSRGDNGGCILNEILANWGKVFEEVMDVYCRSTIGCPLQG